jgi:hypothetical protein
MRQLAVGKVARNSRKREDGLKKRYPKQKKRRY